MVNILIDTCTWLDLAKDYQGQAVLGVLEALVWQKQVSIILPRTVLEEFARNNARVAEESGRSLSSVLKRAKEAVRLSDPALESGQAFRPMHRRSSCASPSTFPTLVPSPIRS